VGVALDVAVAVGVDPPVTTMVPSMPPWAWQKNVYVPADVAENVQ
jgi:hypothetical protein